MLSLILSAFFLIDEASAQINGTCRSMQMYMHAHSLASGYNQSFSSYLEDTLTLCPNGNTCCSKPIETIFYREMKELQTKHAFNKSSYIKQIKTGHSKIEEYTVDILVLSHKSQNRTKAAVKEYLEAEEGQLGGIDIFNYPMGALLDIADSYGVPGITPTPACRSMVVDYLKNLAELQLDGLYLSRLLFRGLPKGLDVLDQLQHQELPTKCVVSNVKAQRCQLCLDNTRRTKACRNYCLDIANICFQHLEEISPVWETYAKSMETVMDMMDVFAAVYQESLESTIQAIQLKLQSDPDAKNSCGYPSMDMNDVARNKRAAESKSRAALVNMGWMVGMIGEMPEKHCARNSIEHEKCWNGTDIAPYVPEKKIEIAKGVAVLTDELKESVNKLQQFNTEFKRLDEVELAAIRTNLSDYNVVTAAPDFVQSSTALLLPSFLLLLVSWLLQ